MKTVIAYVVFLTIWWLGWLIGDSYIFQYESYWHMCWGGIVWLLAVSFKDAILECA
jgi:hypothetical protein